MGNIIGNTNDNNKCIKERIMMGNKAYYTNRQLVNSSLISRNSKWQIYRTLVRPVVTYGSESWTLTMEGDRALAVFERKIMREIYGPVKENDLWRIRRNDELETIIKGENIVRFIKCQRIRWLGHIDDGFGGLVVSMLASGTQVCGSKPGRSRWIFTGVKILSMPSSGGEVK